MDAVRMIEQYEADHAMDDYTTDLEVYLNCIWDVGAKNPKPTTPGAETRDIAGLSNLLYVDSD
jgi:hypothetical protein